MHYEESLCCIDNGNGNGNTSAPIYTYTHNSRYNYNDYINNMRGPPASAWSVQGVRGACLGNKDIDIEHRAQREAP